MAHPLLDQLPPMTAARFAGQYNHAQGGRDTGGDLYAAQGDGSDGTVEVRGDFY
ncbi:hypothetical protein [Actinacidiphila soli]|uniref:hypothetical protein n=1 Tax=Actinacidiphila soli TaxID=2487275 RepID=UPI0013E2C663|nr:hypothetical protein [Actinacidiphila soli]